MLKVYHLSIKGKRRGYLFSQKEFMKGLGIGPRAERLSRKSIHHAMGDYNYFQIELILQNSTTRSNTV